MLRDFDWNSIEIEIETELSICERAESWNEDP